MVSAKRSSAEAELGDADSDSTKKRRVDLQVNDGEMHGHQLMIYGRDVMRRLTDSNILISGMQGLGVEIAKNLILAGVKSVTLHDEGRVELWDLSGSYVFYEKDVGENRASVSVWRLRQLNNSVRVSALTTELTKEHLSKFQAVVFTDISLEKAIEFDDYCHQHQPPIAFIKSEVRGLFGSVYCDFGPEYFTAFNVGKEPCTGIIASISNGNPAIVTCVYTKKLEFSIGDLVVFSEVRGMAEINDGKPRKIIRATNYTFTIEEDTTNYAVYEGGGIVKQSKVLNFKPLRQALKDPGNFVKSDLVRSPALLHLAFQALDMFKIKWGHLPFAGSENDAQEFIAQFTLINNDLDSGGLEKIDAKLLRNFASGARAVLSPMATMFGGIVGQEVVKACSGKFHPIFQFFYFDTTESLPSEPLDPDDLKPLNCRYDAQISVFGSKLQKKLEEARIFIVGSGASGWDFLKNLALMGVCCSETGILTNTDDKVIQQSDLRHFNDSNYRGEANSKLASDAARVINNHIRVENLPLNLSPETEHVFNDTFWENLNVVIAAVDNESARQYLANRCLYFAKALLVSGTLGTECRTQTMIPHVTGNYIPSSSINPYEKEEPPLRHQLPPDNIYHCLTWARSEYERLFETTPTEVNAYLSNSTTFISDIRKTGDQIMARATFERILECFGSAKRYTFKDCIIWARLKFDDYFFNQILQVTKRFPKDAKTSSGDPFSSQPERFPKPLLFSCDVFSHVHFVLEAAILRAKTFSIPIPDQEEAALKQLIVALDKGISPDSMTTSIASIDIRRLAKNLKMMRENLPLNFKLHPLNFEKDDDINHHVDFIAGLANLRARNYGIPEVDRLEANFIMHKMIPRVSTSVNVATGLACLELYKLLGGNQQASDYHNAYLNLAIPSFAMNEPNQLETFGNQNITWSVWDRWNLKGNPTPRKLLQWLKQKDLYGRNIKTKYCLVYSDDISSDNDRLDTKMFDLVKDDPKFERPSGRSYFDVLVECKSAEGSEVRIPLISIYFE